MKEEQVEVTELILDEDAHNQPTENQTSCECSGTEFGKFATAEDLLKSYQSLEREYTKKCQLVKNLNSQIAEFTENNNAFQKDAATDYDTLLNDPEVFSNVVSDNRVINHIIENYLMELTGKQITPHLLNNRGNMLITPPIKPQTVKEAGRMTQELINRRI